MGQMNRTYWFSDRMRGLSANVAWAFACEDMLVACTHGRSHSTQFTSFTSDGRTCNASGPGGGMS